LPGKEQSQEGNGGQGGGQEQAEAAPGIPLRGFDWPEGERGRRRKGRLLLGVFGPP